MGARPLRAVWLTNATGLTLDGGSVSIIDGQAFSGEGLMKPLKAGEKRLLSYAADLGLFVDAKGENVPTRTTKVRIANGLIIQETEERQARTYTAQRGHRAARARARASRPGRLDSRQRFESGRVDGDLAPLPRADPCEDDRDLHR